MPNLRYAHSEGHTDLCYSSNFKYIITCGSEGDVRIWEGVDDVNQKDTCVGEKAWSIAHQGDNLYVGTDTNIIQAYTFPELETDGIITRFTAPVTHIDVSRNGSKLVAGSCDMNIHVIDLNSSDCIKLVGHKAPVLSVCIDPKLEYVVSSGCDGAVKVWSLKTKDVLKQWDCLNKTNSFESSKSLCRIHFQKQGRLLAIPLEDSVRLYERDTWNQVQTLGTEISKDYSIVKFSPCGSKIASGTSNGDILIWDLESEKLLKKENDEKQPVTGIAWSGDAMSVIFCNLSGQIGNIDVPEVQIDDPVDDAVDDPDDIPLAEPVFDDDDDDDENVISLDKIKAQSGFLDDDVTSNRKDESDSESVTSAPGKYTPVSELQPPFQPSSTPSHLQQRFMVWNEVGIVRQFNTEDANEIDVEFHDASSNYGVRLNNHLNHTMAALTANCVVLACQKSEESPSKLVCLVLKSWDGQKEWDCVMPNDEDIIGVTAGDNWVAAVVDTSTLRLFSLDGTQIDLYSIPGNFLCMTGHRNKLGIVYHSGVGMNGDQYLSYCELKINSKSKLLSVINTKPFPISNGTKLRWTGFTDEGSLSSVDSNGMLRISYGTVWRPVCSLDDQCKSKFDHYFIVGISESTHTARAILCKGAFYPQVTPKPLVAEVKWTLPMCELETEKGKLEEEYLRCKITVPSLNYENDVLQDAKRSIEKNILVSIMKLFALACRNDLEARAIALCEAMPTLDVVKLASKYATKMGKHQLAQKVNDIAARMAEPTFHVPEVPDSPAKQENEGFSQDVFSESEPSKENLIFKLQQKQTDASPRPLRLRKTGNPFKKDEPLSSNSQNSSEGKASFLEWYTENQARIQQENPFLKEGELAVAGMKQYKRLSMNESIISNDSEPEPKKRKNDSPEEKPKKRPNTFSKLKAFSFKKPS